MATRVKGIVKSFGILSRNRRNNKRAYFDDTIGAKSDCKATPIYGKYTRSAGFYRTGYKPPME